MGDLREKVPCFNRRIEMKQAAQDLPEIDGVEQIDEPSDGSKEYAGPFYKDQAELLIQRVRILDRARHFISPRTGWPKHIFRK